MKTNGKGIINRQSIARIRPAYRAVSAAYILFPNRGNTAPAIDRMTVAEARAVAASRVYVSMI